MKKNYIILIIIVISLVFGVGGYLLGSTSNNDDNTHPYNEDKKEYIDDNATKLKTISSFVATSKDESKNQITSEDFVDLSNTIIEVIKSKSFSNRFYENYGKGVDLTKDINIEITGNTSYQIVMICNDLDKYECVDIHNSFDKELLETLSSLYNLEFSIVDSASVSR